MIAHPYLHLLLSLLLELQTLWEGTMVLIDLLELYLDKEILPYRVVKVQILLGDNL